MFISKKHKFAYFAAPRVASNSVQNVLENSGFDDESNIIFNFDIESANGETLSDPDSKEAKDLNNYHTSPSSAIQNGYTTLEELRSFTTFGFVRDPIKRWVSRFFLAKHFGFWKGDPADILTLAIRHDLFEGNRPPLIFHWPLREYFYHNDELVVTPYKLDDIDTVLPEIVRSLGGTPPEVIPKIQVGDITPEEYRRPIEEWLPPDCVISLRSYFRADIEFYESL
jgi:hypothetical protein